VTETKIRCVTFDLDDTLWDVDPVIVAANETLYQWLADNAESFTRLYQVEDFPALKEQVLTKWPEVEHSVSRIRLLQLQLGLEHAGYDTEQTDLLSKQAFEVFLEARQRVTFYEHAISALQSLHQSGLKIGALSNGNADVNRVGLGEWFDFQYNADLLGKAKPDPLMFHHMLHEQKLRPEQVVHVGDCPVNDVEAAHNLGLRTVWVNIDDRSGQAVQADATITSLDQLPAVVAMLEKQPRATL